MNCNIPIKILACIVTFVALNAHAEDASKMSVREACKTDVQTYCDDVRPGAGRVVKCLKDHYKKLSDDCYVALNKGLKKEPEDASNPPSSDANASPDDKE